MSRETDIVIDAGAMAISLSLVDRLISQVVCSPKNRGRFYVNTFTIISHPNQADAVRAVLALRPDGYVKNSYVLETNAEKRVARWLELPDFPEDVIRVESPGACGEIIHLSTVF